MDKLESTMPEWARSHNELRQLAHLRIPLADPEMDAETQETARAFYEKISQIAGFQESSQDHFFRMSTPPLSVQSCINPQITEAIIAIANQFPQLFASKEGTHPEDSAQ